MPGREVGIKYLNTGEVLEIEVLEFGDIQVTEQFIGDIIQIILEQILDPQVQVEISQ
jgi:hypothetical protein